MSTVVITGGSSGFGLEAALAFARAGYRVYATMRELERGSVLRTRAEAEGLAVQLRELDVTLPASFREVLDGIADDAGGLDVLVNNAGILRAGALEDLSESQIRDVLETNLTGPLLLSRTVLPRMRKQRSGCIIMVSSLSGIAGLPGDVAYTASKFGIEGATEALRHEVDRWGIRVALVEAGMYATAIMSSSLPADSILPDYYPDDSPYRPLIENSLRALRQRLPDALDPANVAELLVTIAASDGSRLRWPADDVATTVLEKMLAQDDAGRDEFLRSVAGTDWWSDGHDAPDNNEER